MNRKDILDALNEISDARIAKAATPPKKRAGNIGWYGAIAAVLAAAILLGIFLSPQSTTPSQMYDPTWPTGRPTQTTQPTYTNPTIPTWPTYNPNYTSSTSPTQSNGQYSYYSLAAPVYPAQKNNADISQEIAGLQYYFTRTMEQFLQDGDNNTAFSPINLYMALAMLAETTAGDTRAEILALLGTTDLAKLRQQTNALWNNTYYPGKNPCILANSLWMQKGASYNKEVTDLLANNYYASVFGNDFSAAEAAKPIAQWIDQETGGVLKEQTAALAFDPQTIMALVSTVYFEAGWGITFNEKFNTKGTFYGSKGDSICTYMNHTIARHYYQGENYSAISLSLKEDYTMWFVLPKEGKTTENLLKSGEYTDLFLGDKEGDLAMVNLSLPKFDISCKRDMADGLQRLGVKKVFQKGSADFSPVFPGAISPVWINKVEQATRVIVNENGVTAAGYTVISTPGSAAPPSLRVEFVLDRPFLFVITNEQGLPIFAGCVNNV